MRRKARSSPKAVRNDLDSAFDSGWNAEDDGERYENAVKLPAFYTKHLGELVYRFPSIDTSFRIVQRNDTNSTGSSLWLSSQVLSSYLLHTYAGKAQRKDAHIPHRKVLELGSGTGLLSLLMARLGWQVTATDIPPVLHSVLEPNVQVALDQLVHQGLAAPDQIHVSELDWTVPPEQWHWHPTFGYPSTKRIDAPFDIRTDTCDQRFDLILTTDTIYEPSIIRPLMSVISHLVLRQKASRPTVLLALERRDPAHIDEALAIAKQDLALPFKQIPAKRVRKIFDALGDGAAWSRDDWAGVEIWQL